jgi:hypothetical protein
MLQPRAVVVVGQVLPRDLVGADGVGPGHRARLRLAVLGFCGGRHGAALVTRACLATYHPLKLPPEETPDRPRPRPRPPQPPKRAPKRALWSTWPAFDRT